MSSPGHSALRVAQISDCHLYADKNQQSYCDIAPYHTLRQIFARLVEHDPDILIVSGDITNDHSRQSYLHLRDLHHHFLPETTMMLLPGNHDQQKYMVEVFDPAQLWLSGSLTVGKWQIHCLDSQTESKLGYVEPSQLTRLSQCIDVENDLYHLVAVHHHPIAVNGWMDKLEWLNRDVFLQFVSERPAIKAVIYGHIHADRHHQRGNTHFWACPSSCWQWQHSQEFAVSELNAGFRLLHCFDSGEIDTQVYRLSAT